MKKSRPFSIYLLKEGHDSTNSLKDGHELDHVQPANAPEDAVVYILDADPKPPWWKGYFGIQETLSQEQKGALIFLPVAERWFALSFGQVFHHLSETAYEYDFGLRVTLNSLDPKELKSADMVEPGAARRKRTQVPVSTELTYLDFDGNSEIIKSLTGKVKEEYQELFKNATGSAALKVSLALDPDEISGKCETLLQLYSKEDYKQAFPNIQNIVPVKDPTKVETLNEILVQSLREQDGRTTLAIPEIVDYRDNTCCIFTGDGQTSDIFPDISIEHFYEFLNSIHFDLAEITLEKLSPYRMQLSDIDGNVSKSYSFYRTLIFETEQAEQGLIYHLCEGDWYQVEKNYLEKLTAYIDAKCTVSTLCPYNHDVEKSGKTAYSEENYNQAVPAWNKAFICLDQTDISPSGNTQIEPCDLYTVEEDTTSTTGYRGVLYHIKISSRSSLLSHLFNQGVNSIELIQLEPNSKEKMKQVVRNNLGSNDEKIYTSPVDSYSFKVIFGIVTHKALGQKSENLPLFSKISLMRNMQRLDLMKTPSELIFIEDQSPKKDGHAKHQKILVEVYQNAAGKTEVRPIPGQDGFPSAQVIKGCPKQIRESPIGTRYRLAVARKEDNSLSSFHAWPFNLVAN